MNSSGYFILTLKTNTMELGLIPIKNFGIVEENKIYRSAQPIYDYEYKWLKQRIGLAKIINLREESEHDEHFAPKWNIEVAHINVKDHHAPSEENIEQFINILKESVNDGKSILFHCEHGNGRTSTFNIITRLFQGWTLDEALEEENNKFFYKFNHPVQIKFLKELPKIVEKYKQNVQFNNTENNKNTSIREEV